MGFQEKSAWACLISIVAVFVPYFLVVFQQPLAFVGLFVLAVIALVIFLTAFHLVNALMTRSIRKSRDVPPQDELDRMIELQAAKRSGFVLAAVVLVWSVIVMFGVPALGLGTPTSTSGSANDAAPLQLIIPLNQALTAIQVLFGGFVVANLAYYGSIVAGYRRLAGG